MLPALQSKINVLFGYVEPKVRVFSTRKVDVFYHGNCCAEHKLEERLGHITKSISPFVGYLSPKIQWVKIFSHTSDLLLFVWLRDSIRAERTEELKVWSFRALRCRFDISDELQPERAKENKYINLQIYTANDFLSAVVFSGL